MSGSRAVAVFLPSRSLTVAVSPVATEQPTMTRVLNLVTQTSIGGSHTPARFGAIPPLTRTRTENHDPRLVKCSGRHRAHFSAFLLRRPLPTQIPCSSRVGRAAPALSLFGKSVQASGSCLTTRRAAEFSRRNFLTPNVRVFIGIVQHDWVRFEPPRQLHRRTGFDMVLERSLPYSW